MSDKPKVSVIIPIYNVEKYLRECLDSVVNQTLQDIEIICVNDGSTDNCGEILKEYAAKDNRILVVKKFNGGYGSACNAGLSKASGEYIAILEPDDYIAPEMYEKLYNLAVENDADIVKSPFYEKFDTYRYKKVKKINWRDNFAKHAQTFTIYEHPEFLSFHPSVWSCIYRREFINKHNIRFVEAKGAGWTDNPFQVQTMCLAKRIFYTDEAFYYWRRLNITASDDLKDYTVPFKRSDEIHEWLAQNGITDENLLACLYKRELSYILIMFGMLPLKNLPDALELVSAMLNRMDTGIIKNNKFITLKDKNRFTSLKIFPLVYFLMRFKNFRRKFINIRWNKREKSVMLFGRKILEMI
jgi:glycosyltransferase involved in cell wall biosynthesis